MLPLLTVSSASGVSGWVSGQSSNGREPQTNPWFALNNLSKQDCCPALVNMLIGWTDPHSGIKLLQKAVKPSDSALESHQRCAPQCACYTCL